MWSELNLSLSEKIEQISDLEIFESTQDESIYSWHTIKRVMWEFQFNVDEAISFLDLDKKDEALHWWATYPQ